MADYHAPTVVRPSVPSNAITRLEHALLTGMFEHEADGDAIYFYSSEGPSETVWLDIAELRDMLNDEAGNADSVVALVDEADDEGFDRSRSYGPDHEPDRPPAKGRAE